MTVDRAPDVDESLKDSAVFVGEASIVLFEAREFGRHVIARDSGFPENVIGDVFGARTSNVEEVVGRLRSTCGDEVIVTESDPTTWSRAAMETYSRWLDVRLDRSKVSVIG